MSSENQNGEEWLSISDLMSGLMLIFLLIAITFMYQVNKDKEKILVDKKELEEYKRKIEAISKEFAIIEENLNKVLQEEFTPEELEKWNVVILSNNTVSKIDKNRKI